MVQTVDYDSAIRAPDQLQVDGRFLEDAVPGYRQLSVSGRHLAGQEVTLVDIPARNGAWLEAVRTGVVEYEIQFAIKFSTTQQLQAAFNKLNKLLRGNRSDDLITVSFKDIPSYSNQALLKGVSEKEQTDCIYTGSFSLIFPNPSWKKSPQSSTGTISLTDAFEVLPSKIEATVSSNASELEVRTPRSRMKFIGHYTAGKRLVVEWLADEIKVTYDGRSILSELAHLSVPEDFYLRNGDMVTGQNLTINRVEWRDERL